MSQENVERVRSAYDALARRDIEAIKALAREYPPAPGFEFESVLTGQVYGGTQGVLDLAADMWETVDYAGAAEEFLDAGDRFAVRNRHMMVVRVDSFVDEREALEADGLSE